MIRFQLMSIPCLTPLFSLNSKMLVLEFTSHILIVFSFNELETTTSLYIAGERKDFEKRRKTTKNSCENNGNLNKQSSCKIHMNTHLIIDIYLSLRSYHLQKSSNEAGLQYQVNKIIAEYENFPVN